MMIPYFENVSGIGTLYLEKTFLKFEEENILFVCLDDAGNRYLGVCYEMRYALKWVLCQVSKETILQMLLKLVTVRECFERAGDNLVLITYTEENGEEANRKCLQEIDTNILPDEDFVLKYDAEKDAYCAYICNEMFGEKSIERTMKVEAMAYSYVEKRKERVPAEKFVVINKSRSYGSGSRNWQENWAC